MEFITRLKQLEDAYKSGHITPTEYHGFLNHFLGRLAADEIITEVINSQHVTSR